MLTLDLYWLAWPSGAPPVSGPPATWYGLLTNNWWRPDEGGPPATWYGLLTNNWWRPDEGAEPPVAPPDVSGRVWILRDEDDDEAFFLAMKR